MVYKTHSLSLPHWVAWNLTTRRLGNPNLDPLAKLSLWHMVSSTSSFCTQAKWWDLKKSSEPSTLLLYSSCFAWNNNSQKIKCTMVVSAKVNILFKVFCCVDKVHLKNNEKTFKSGASINTVFPLTRHTGIILIQIFVSRMRGSFLFTMPFLSHLA